jgi:flagellin
MNELAVKAANGTNSKDDRDYIQAEVDQLVTEIDRVSTTTKFNETYLLKGDHGDGTGALTWNTANDLVGAAFTGLSFDSVNGEAELTISELATKTATQGASEMFQYTDGYTAARQAPTYERADVTVGDVKYSYITNIKAGTETKPAVADPAADAVVHPIDLTFDTIKTVLTAGTDDADTKFFASKEEMLAAIKNDINEVADKSIKSLTANGDKIKISAFADLNKGLDISLHVGADSTKDNKIGLTIEMMSARGLGINGIRVDGDTDANATASIDVIKAAIQKVSEQRSTLGAVQNRLEHTIANLDNIVENTQSAESAIRDTDMATQMVKYSNNNILAQAGQAMLSQANQSNQGVLSLLQ